jgi:hypothetical protein
LRARCSDGETGDEDGCNAYKNVRSLHPAHFF